MAVRLEKAVRCFEIEDYEGAIQEYTFLLDEISNNKHFLLLSNQGIAYLKLGKTNQAIKCFKLAAEKFPEQYESLHNLGITYMHINKNSDALDCFKRVLKKESKFLPTLCAQTLLFCNEDKLKQAKSTFNQIPDASKDTYVVKICQSIIYLKTNEYEKSIELLKSLNVDRKDIKLLISTTFYKLSRKLYFQRKKDLSIEFLEKSLEYHETSEKWRILGCLLLPSLSSNMNSKFFEMSINYFKKSLLFNSDNSQALENLGMTYVTCYQYEESVEFLKKFLDLNINTDDHLSVERVRLNLGIVYFKLKAYSKARRIFNSILELNSENSIARYALDNLDFYETVQTKNQPKQNITVSSPVKEIKPEPSGFDFGIDMSDIENLKFNLDDLKLDIDGGHEGLGEEKSEVEVEINIYPIRILRDAVREKRTGELEGVLFTKIEESLSDSEFKQYFKMTRSDFELLDSTQQKEMKVSLGLELE